MNAFVTRLRRVLSLVVAAALVAAALQSGSPALGALMIVVAAVCVFANLPAGARVLRIFTGHR